MTRATLLLLAFLPLAGQQYDLLIRSARVVDGTGAPWISADVAVKDGRIVAVGKLGGATARTTIEAKGRVLSPGFIDVHTHVEGRDDRVGIEDLPDALNFLSDGVTTLLTGNCGSSQVDLKMWFQGREKSGLGPNLATLVGHGSVRRAVMGNAERKPTEAELLKMTSLVDAAMRDGAYGISTGLIYVPGTYADTAEIVELAKVVSKHGGVYSSHMRNESNGVFKAVAETAEIGRSANVPVQVSHLKIAAPKLWGQSTTLLASIDKLRQDGVDVVVDQYPYTRSSTTLNTTVPSWALADGHGQFMERLADPATKAKIKADMARSIEQRGLPDFAHATVASCLFDRAVEGKNISEINVLRGREKTVANEAETILELLSKGPVQMVYHTMSDQDVERILGYPNTTVASDGYIVRFGEGVPHPRSYGTRARVLGEFVRQKKTLTLEDAIRRMTSLPARTFGFTDRGLIRPGAVADLVLLDPSRVQEKATFTEPHQYSDGFDYVWVSGTAVIENGKHTKARPGKVLRKPGRAP